MKRKLPDPELVRQHNEAWKAFTSLPLYQETETLYKQLSELETWQPGCDSFDAHVARYEAGKPQEIRQQIARNQTKLYETPEAKRWFELYQKVHK